METMVIFALVVETRGITGARPNSRPPTVSKAVPAFNDDLAPGCAGGHQSDREKRAGRTVIATAPAGPAGGADVVRIAEVAPIPPKVWRITPMCHSIRTSAML